jgi:DNA-binding PadR family transcriptional regulator
MVADTATDAAARAGDGMTSRLSHKALLLLGLLRHGPMTGYELNRVVRAHGHLYADLKKGNIYHLLDGLAHQGYLDMTAEPGARGPRGEKLLYGLTQAGREAFRQLLKDVMTSFEPADTGLASAVVFLPELDREEAMVLLRQREHIARERRRLVADELASVEGTLLRLAGDHLLAAIDAELSWTAKALQVVEGSEWGEGSDRHQGQRGLSADAQPARALAPRAMTEMSVPLDAEQLLRAGSGADVEVVLEVDRVATTGRLQATLLEPTEAAATARTYRRSDLRVTVRWGERTTVVMGGTDDVTAGAVVRVHGRVRDGGDIAAELIAVLTGLTSVADPDLM